MNTHKNTYPGTLITIEGIDGSGKSTLAINLHNALQKRGINALATKQPGGTSIGKLIQQILQKDLYAQTEYLIFAADRAQHAQEVLIHALTKNTIVVCDRMADSSVVYQGYGRGLSIQMIKQINDWALQGIQPNIVFYLELSIAQAQKRLEQRNIRLTSFEKEESTFWENIIKGYKELYKNRPDVCRLDATKTPEELTHDALEELVKRDIIKN
jgi:dTMP kinase